MSRVNKIVALLVAVISLSKEDAFAHRGICVLRGDHDGFRGMHARRALFPHHHKQEGRGAISVSVRPRAVFAPVPLYAIRACRPLMVRMGILSSPCLVPSRAVLSPVFRMGLVSPAPLFQRRVFGPVLMNGASPCPGLMRTGGVLRKVY
ncbi:MAG: hypothetical protein HYX35_04525 [Proteobacteria bacterium]|nr:hypothetical protein [Pseudomonadota bacterium]